MWYRYETHMHSSQGSKCGSSPCADMVRAYHAAGYAGAVNVSPTNFYLAPGEKTLDELMAAMGDGLVITEVSGLHAGANPVSGDFSLLAKGYTVEEGKKAKPVEQITVAGNFYTLLKNIRGFGNDLEFVGSPVGSPSVDAGEMNVAGK